MTTLAITDTEFDEKVLKSDRLCLVDFWATWCGPCRKLGPVIEEISQEYGDKINVFKCDVDTNPETSAKYGIRSIPFVIFFKDGEIVKSFVGFQAKDKIVALIEECLLTENSHAA